MSGIDPADVRAVHRALAAVPGYDGPDVTITALSGGLTNRSYRVATAAAPPVVVRVAGDVGSPVSIDRVAECANARAAAHAGVAPRVLLCDPGAGVSVVEWLDGRTLEPRDLDDTAALTQVAALLRTLHAAPRFVNTVDLFAVQREYRDVVRTHGLPLPRRYDEFAPQLDAVAAALAVGAEGNVPCHNDLVAANVVDDGARLWFVDFEFAGNNDPCFELGNLWSEADLGIERLAELVTAYYGRDRPDRVARARLFALLGQYTWTLWASIQDAVSRADFDFASRGRHNYERAVATFTSVEFGRLLDEARVRA
jgi:thiamine kinase-like enzyme